METVTLALKEFMPPDCPCAIEDKLMSEKGGREGEKVTGRFFS